jgi:hypothetical protein
MMRCVLIFALLVSSGCTLALTRRPAQIVAPLGVQVLTAVEAAQSAIIRLGRDGLIPPEQERPAIEATVKIGHAGKRLAVALRAIDNAQTAVARAQATGEVSALLEALSGLLWEVLAPITDGSVRGQVTALLREVSGLLLTISGAIVRAG